MNINYISRMRLRAFLQAIRAPHQGSSIELGPRPPRPTQKNPQNLRRPSKKFPIEVFQINHQYSHPQESSEDDEDPEFSSDMSEDPQMSGLSLRGRGKDKGISPFIIFILCLYIVIGLAPISGMGYYMLTFREASMKEKQDPESLRFLSANLNADPIMDIQVLERGFTCPLGYERLKLGTWPGTTEGCLCENGDLYGTSCEQLGSEKCKKDIPRTPPVDIYEWNKEIWCAKRAIFGTEYLKKVKCPFGFKECYTGGCFKGACPITKVEIGFTGNNTKTKTVAFSNMKGELPVVNVQITLGDVPCFTQELFAQNIKNSSYELSAIKENQCDKYGLNKDFTTKIDSQAASNAFTSFPSPVLRLPHFQENAKTTTAILSSMTRIKIAAKHDHCLDINEKPLHKFTETWQKYTFWIFLALTIDLLFRIIPIYQIFCSLSSSNRVKDPEGSEDSSSLCHYLNLLSFIPTFIAVILFYSLHPQVVVLKKYFGEYNSLKCYDGSQGNMVISDYLNIGESIEASFWVEQVILFSSICSAFVSFMLKSGKI